MKFGWSRENVFDTKLGMILEKVHPSCGKLRFGVVVKNQLFYLSVAVTKHHDQGI